jgi:glycosyltransferase involved in cell wall biosynthesis
MSRNTIRVLTLIENAAVTGPARNVIEFAKMAARAEADLPAVEVTIVTYRRGLEESALALAARQAGLAVATVAERRRWDTGVFPLLRQTIAQVNPDILETRNVKSHFLVRLLGLHRRYPWVAWNHGYTTTSLLDRAYTQLDRWSLRGAYRVVTVCRPFADHLARLGVPRERITILHNSVKPFVPPSEAEVQRVRQELALPPDLGKTPAAPADPRVASAAPNNRPPADDEAVVLSVGRLSREKGHADLLRAAAALKDMSEAPRFRVVMVGDGPEREPLARLAVRLGIEKQVTLAGFQREVRPYYSLATLVAVPSHSEGSPNVVLEAMAAGLPIVANAVGGVPEILREGVTGLMVEPRHPEAMAKAILRILSNPDLKARLGAEARTRAEAHHTPEAYRRALVRFYQQTVESGQWSVASGQ